MKTENDNPEMLYVKDNNAFTDIFFLILSCIIAGFLIKIPAIFPLNETEPIFYERNAGLIVLLGVSMYTMLIKGLFKKPGVFIFFGAFGLSALYINILPILINSSSIDLAYLHLPLLLWCIFGFIYGGFDSKDLTKRMEYIRFNGDLIVLTTLILIAGALFAAITGNLFKVIGIDIMQFYPNYIVVWGSVSAPILATYIIRNYPAATNKIAPIIATIFSPVVLVTLFVFLCAIPFGGKDPYKDRDFLLMFNLMLLGVMALIVFSIAETGVTKNRKFNTIVLLALAMVTLIINLVALSAILYRLGEYGFTPNRVAVLGSNLLIFINLILIAIDLFKVNFKNAEMNRVELTISRYLPFYAIWTLFVTFGFPVMFGYK